MKLSRHLLFLFLLSTQMSCLEDTFEPISYGSLSGTVYDNFNDTPLQGVEINTNPSSSVVLTDSLGNFSISEILAGEYSFTATLNGYEKTFVDASIITGINTEIVFKMDRMITIPDEAVNPSPPSGSDDMERDLVISWETTTPKNDSLTYDIYVFESDIDTAAYYALNSKDTFMILNDLRFETTYYWQVNVKSSTGGLMNGTVWSFSTLEFPDNRIAFASITNGVRQIYSSDESGDQKIQVTRTTANNLHPKFNTNRTEIAYSTNKNIDYHIEISERNGTNPRRITNLPIAGYHNNGAGFNWWPDNGGFIYSHYEKLYSIDRNGSNLNLLATAPPDRHFRTMDYCGITNRIVVQTVGSLIYDGEIYIMDEDGSNPILVVDNFPGIIQDPIFYIDGMKILYTRDASGFNSPDGRQLDSRIYLLDLMTMQTTDLSQGKVDGTNDLQPRFSPFGSEIIFTNMLNDGSGQSTVYKMDLSGGNRILLFENAEMPDWK